MERWALPVEDAYGQQRHAGALGLEGQVKPRPPQLVEAQQFDIGAPVAADPPQVVGGDRGHFGVRVLHPGRVSGRGLVTVTLVVIQVEGFFTVTAVQTRTFHHGEPEGTIIDH